MSSYYKNLFKKFIDHDISSEELEQLLRWINRNEDFKDVEILEKLWANLETSKAIDKNTAKRIQSKLISRIRTEKSIRSDRMRRLSPWWISVAAGLLVVVLSGIGLMRYLNSNVVVTSDFGEIVEVRLPDNSLVRLNANSEISYPRRWQSQEVRTVSLEGEAFFEVSKDLLKHKKFVVQTKDLSVEVLGTEFNVNARDLSTKVFLETGSVKLSALNRSDTLMMVPGEEAGFDHNGILSKSKPTLTLSPTDWKDGSVILKDVKLSDILNEYENVFGDKYYAKDTGLLDQAFTVVFPITDERKAVNILQKLTGNLIEMKEN